MSVAELPAQTAVPTSAVPDRTLYRLSVDQFERMIDADVLNDEPRTELIEGLMLQMSPMGTNHEFSMVQVGELLRAIVPAEYHVRSQVPIRCATSMPEPDGFVVRGISRDLRGRRALPAEVPLVVEVADSSLAFDRTTKHAVYAAELIPEYWIVNLVDRQVEVFASPKEESPGNWRYQDRRIVGAQESLTVCIDGRSWGVLPVAELLP